MEWRTKLGALLGAGGLLMLAASAVVAAPPTYTIDVTKSANPASVPIAGGSVVYTISVHNTGTGQFLVVNIDDGMVGCTLGVPTGDDGDGKLEGGETWAYTCTVTGVTPGIQNTATVTACHDAGPCNVAHDATDTDSATVTGSEVPITEPPTTEPPTTEPPITAPPITAPPVTAPPVTAPPVTAPPVTAPPTINPCDCTIDPNFTDAVAPATEPTTDAEVGAAAGAGGNGIMLVLALGMLLASLVLVTPAKPIRQR
jgi:hypothetical protein